MYSNNYKMLSPMMSSSHKFELLQNKAILIVGKDYYNNLSRYYQNLGSHDPQMVATNTIIDDQYDKVEIYNEVQNEYEMQCAERYDQELKIKRAENIKRRRNFLRGSYINAPKPINLRSVMDLVENSVQEKEFVQIQYTKPNTNINTNPIKNYADAVKR